MKLPSISAFLLALFLAVTVQAQTNVAPVSAMPHSDPGANDLVMFASFNGTKYVWNTAFRDSFFASFTNTATGLYWWQQITNNTASLIASNNALRAMLTATNTAIHADIASTNAATMAALSATNTQIHADIASTNAATMAALSATNAALQAQITDATLLVTGSATGTTSFSAGTNTVTLSASKTLDQGTWLVQAYMSGSFGANAGSYHQARIDFFVGTNTLTGLTTQNNSGAGQGFNATLVNIGTVVVTTNASPVTINIATKSVSGTPPDFEVRGTYCTFVARKISTP